MICKPCASRNHWECDSPPSCPCAHKTSGPDGAFDLWTYTPIPIVLDGAGHAWVWRVTHPEEDEVYIDRSGHLCTVSFGETGMVLSPVSIEVD